MNHSIFYKNLLESVKMELAEFQTAKVLNLHKSFEMDLGDIIKMELRSNSTALCFKSIRMRYKVHRILSVISYHNLHHVRREVASILERKLVPDD